MSTVEPPPTITLELTIDQATWVSWAAENIARLQMMQFDVLTGICHRSSQPYPDHHDIDELSRQLKHLYSPDLSPNAYWGIYNNEIHRSARTLFDIHQVIRQELAFRRCPISRWTVDYDNPHHLDETQPLPKIIDNTDWPIIKSFFKRMELSIRQMITKRGWHPDSVEVNQWIEQCKAFAIHEHEHITTTNTPLPQDEYLTFFNEYIDEKGYVKWKE